MISYLLGTNAVIVLLGGKSDRLAQRMLTREPGSVALPTIVAHELYFGAYESGRVARNLETIRLLTADVPVLEFDRRDALVSGEVGATLGVSGTSIGPYDLLIAGRAKARGMTILTNNVGEFGRVVGLRVEDWTV